MVDLAQLPRLPDRPPATRLRAVLLVVLLTIGITDLVAVQLFAPARAADAVAVTPFVTPPLPILVPPATPLTAGPSVRDAADIAFVRRYYALLPRNPTAAFRLLGPAARSQSGGLSRYTAFYSGIAAVSIDPTPAVVGPSTVAAVIRFRRRTGEVTYERYELVVMTGPAGERLLWSYRRT